VSTIPAAYLLCSTAIRRDIPAAWCFCSCELPCRSVGCVLLHLFNAQPYTVEFTYNGSAPKTVVPKLGINSPTGVICGSSGGNMEPKPQCCSVLWAITGKEIFDMKCEKFSLRVIRYNRYLDLGNGSNKFGNNWPRTTLFRWSWNNSCILRAFESGYNDFGLFVTSPIAGVGTYGSRARCGSLRL